MNKSYLSCFFFGSLCRLSIYKISERNPVEVAGETAFPSCWYVVWAVESTIESAMEAGCRAQQQILVPYLSSFVCVRNDLDPGGKCAEGVL